MSGTQSARDTVIVTVTWLIPFITAATWLWRFLFSAYDLRGARLVRMLFSASFALSMGMLLLVIYEVASVLDPRTRWLTWRITFVLDVALLVVVLPVSFIYFLARGFSFLSFRAVRLLTVVFEIGFIWVFWQAGKMFPIMRGGVAHEFLSLEGFIGRLGVIGVTTAAILAGYGSISTPYNYLSVFLQEVKDRDILAARRNLKNTINALLDKQTQLAVAWDTLEERRVKRRQERNQRLQQQQQQQLPPQGQHLVEASGGSYSEGRIVMQQRRSVTPSRRRNLDGTLAVPPPPPDVTIPPYGAIGVNTALNAVAVGPWQISSPPPFAGNQHQHHSYSTVVGVAESPQSTTPQSSSNDLGSDPRPHQPSPVIVSPTVVIVGRRDRTPSGVDASSTGFPSPVVGAFPFTNHAPGSARKSAHGGAVTGALKKAWKLLGGGDTRDDLDVEGDSDEDVEDASAGGAANAVGGQNGAETAPAGSILEAKRAVRSLRREASALQVLQREMSMELEEMAATRERILVSRTLKGRFFNALGYFLSVYGVYRVISAMISIVMKQAPGKDPVTRGFEILLIFLNVPNAHLWMQPVSFTFIGILVFTNVRGILISFSNIFSALGSRSAGSNNSSAVAVRGGIGKGKAPSLANGVGGSSRGSDSSAGGASSGGGGGGGGGVTTHAMVLLLAQVMGTYFVATVLMMRMSMPEQFRQGVSRSIGEIEFSFFHRWFDVIYVLSACASIIIFMTSYALRASRSSGMSAEEREAFKGGDLVVEFEQGEGDEDDAAAQRNVLGPSAAVNNKGAAGFGYNNNKAVRMAKSLSPASSRRANSLQYGQQQPQPFVGARGNLFGGTADNMRKRLVGNTAAAVGAAAGASAVRINEEDEEDERNQDDDADENKKRLLLLKGAGAGIATRAQAAQGRPGPATGAGAIGPRGRALNPYDVDRAALFSRGKVVSSAANAHEKIP